MNENADITRMLVPGLRDSEAGHWQSRWHEQNPQWLRVKQRNWAQVDLEGWITAIDREQKLAKSPLLLIGTALARLPVWCGRTAIRRFAQA